MVPVVRWLAVVVVLLVVPVEAAACGGDDSPERVFCEVGANSPRLGQPRSPDRPAFLYKVGDPYITTGQCDPGDKTVRRG